MPSSAFRPDRLFPALRTPAILAFLSLLPTAARAQGESGQICEVKPAMRCLDKAKIEGDTLKVPLDAAAIQRDGFLVCDSSFNYTTAPDIVLIMDNTASMDSVRVENGIPRWCEPGLGGDDPECISGDPSNLRGPALRTFLDSALVKGGKGINVGVVTFNKEAEAKSDKLIPLTSATIDSIKASIVMEERESTNYNEAFLAALDLLATSRKPKSEQFIIFVSDGRPNQPANPGDPYIYKDYWDKLPVVHSIFLGSNKDNYKDMEDISAKTKGIFFKITDVKALASYLTDNLAKELFRQATPTLTTITNLSDNKHTFQIEAVNHIPQPDSGAFILRMPGPMQLVPGINDFVMKTEYGYGGTTQDVHFKIERSATGPYFSGLEKACRSLPKLLIYNSKDENLSATGAPFTIGDSSVRYSLTTTAKVDSFDVIIRTTSRATAQQDLESVRNNDANRKDSTWTGAEAFQHQTIGKIQGDNLVQAEHGETIVVSYRNPFIREDSATERVKIKYGPEFDKAAYRDLDHDGRIETVTIRYLEPLAALPAKLQFKIVDAAGASAERTAAGGEIRFGTSGGAEDRNSLIVTLVKPFPFGMTSVANPDSSGRTFRQLDIPMTDGAFRVDDSVPPVIVSAAVTTDKATGASKVTVTYSEPITLAEPFLEPLVFKRDTVEFTSKDLPISRIEKLDDRRYAFTIQAGTAFKPVGGDSVSINNNGETRDLAGTAPKQKTFAAMSGAAPSQQISDFYVTFSNGSRSGATGASDSPDNGVKFIPVDARGYSVPGTDNGKCGGCTAQQGGVFTGSVINVVTRQPVRWEFTIYTNLGQVVAHGSGKVEEADLKLLDKVEDPSGDPNLTDYVQRIVWTGRTDQGNFVGSGAFVLQAVFHYDRNFRTGARPSTGTRITKFGFLRACCNAFNRRWFD